MDVLDRWALRAWRPLDEVAGLRGRLQARRCSTRALVWPFQLAWPAFAFAASRRAGHRGTYARVFTYLVAVLSFAALAAALLAPTALPWLAGAGEVDADAARVVPWVRWPRPATARSSSSRRRCSSAAGCEPWPGMRRRGGGEPRPGPAAGAALRDDGRGGGDAGRVRSWRC
ncbi:MAG: hypothetical protein U0802_22685 [Candidatus Binatia bacterium]